MILIVPDILQCEGDVYLQTLLRSAFLGTDSNGKIIATAFVEVDPLSLHLDQTAPQVVTGGAPIFNGGLNSNGSITLQAGQKLILDGA